ncbi:DNA-directed DNA polymerase [Tanacetum coccineum]
MTRSTVKRLAKPLDEPEREFRRRRKAALCKHQNESLAIAGRNLFDDEASSSYNIGAKPPTPPKTLYEHSHLNSSGFLNPIAFPTEQTGRIADSRKIWLVQNTCTFQGLKNEVPLRHIRHYLSIVDNIQADGATRDTSRLRFFHFSLKGKATEWLDRIPLTQVTTWDQLVSRFLNHFFPVGRTSALRDPILRFKKGDNEPIKSSWIRFQDLIRQVPHHGIQRWLLWALKKACNRISFLEIPTREVGLKNPYLICDYCGGSHEVDECEQNNPSEQICLSGGDIYNDPSLLRFYQNDDTSPRGNSKCKEKGDDGSEWIIRSKFEDELAKFMLEKKSQAKGIEDMLV